jgi:hypothetical protein
VHQSRHDSPATKRRFTSDILYPLPDSSKSMPDSVVPSQLNCVMRIDGVDGPSPISRRARNVSTPTLSECCEMSVKFHTSLFDSPNLKYRENCLNSSPPRRINHSPHGTRHRLLVLYSSIDRHRDGYVQQRRRRCHRMTIVFVFNLNISLSWFTLPVRHQLQRTALSSRQALHGVLQDVQVEV